MIKNDILDTTELNISTMNMLTALQTKLAIYNAKYNAGIISYNEYKENINDVEASFENVVNNYIEGLNSRIESIKNNFLNAFGEEENNNV